MGVAVSMESVSARIASELAAMASASENPGAERASPEEQQLPESSHRQGSRVLLPTVLLPGRDVAPDADAPATTYGVAAPPDVPPPPRNSLASTADGLPVRLRE